MILLVVCSSEIESYIGVIYALQILLYVSKSIFVLLTVIEAMNKILGKCPVFQFDMLKILLFVFIRSMYFSTGG